MAITSKSELKTETRLNALDNFKSLQGKLNPQNGSARDPSLTEKSVSAEKKPTGLFRLVQTKTGNLPEIRKINSAFDDEMQRSCDRLTP